MVQTSLWNSSGLWRHNKYQLPNYHCGKSLFVEWDLMATKNIMANIYPKFLGLLIFKS
jgi:hypothetical protein